MDFYLPVDPYYNEATDLAAFMGERGDVDLIHNMLQCSQVLRDGKPKPRIKLRREQKLSRLKGLVWTNMLAELRSAWIHKDDKNKEPVITQFK